MAQNKKNIKKPDLSKVQVSTPSFDKLKRENTRPLISSRTALAIELETGA